MSISVLKRGLDLLNEDLKVKGMVKGQKRKSTKKAAVMDQISTKKAAVMDQISTKKAAVMDQIGTSKQGVRKQIRRLQTHNKTRKNRATVKDKQIRNALEEYRKKQKKSRLNSNLQYFLGTSYKMQESSTKKILQQNVGRQSRHQPDKPIKKQEKQSLFTEAEFQKFQEEYFSKL